MDLNFKNGVVLSLLFWVVVIGFICWVISIGGCHGH